MDELITKVKVLLDISDTEIYDAKLEILVPGGMSKLKNEGIPFELIKEDDKLQMSDYAICLAYQISLDLDFDVDIKSLARMYANRVISLRESLHVE